MKTYFRIHPTDNVAVALAPLSAGTSVELDGISLTLAEDIPQGHKFALTDIPEDAQIIKYGYPIGIAKEDIHPGCWVHIHNIRTGLGDLLTYTYDRQAADVAPTEERFFQGYRRADGRAAVRNELWIIPTVGCVNNIATAIERKAQYLVKGTVDAVAAFPHPYGCSQMGDDQEHTRTILADLINHPNAGGVLVLGLGCENSNIDVLKGYIGDYDENRVKFLVCQESDDEMADALALLEQLAEYAGQFHREPISCSELVIGMKCGGSDGLSGITANPTVGAFSDLLISKGGTTILTEVPEMFGAETQLKNRCENEELFHQTVDLINNFKEYFKSHGQTIYENPSPGNDLVASTALAASGAHIVLFTTGRGTPFASPVPTVKISTNNRLYDKKNNWIDFNCGTLVEGDTLPELRDRFFDYVISVASGEEVKSEKAGFHDMAIFKQGVTL